MLTKAQFLARNFDPFHQQSAVTRQSIRTILHVRVGDNTAIVPASKSLKGLEVDTFIALISTFNIAKTSSSSSMKIKLCSSCLEVGRMNCRIAKSPNAELYISR